MRRKPEPPEVAALRQALAEVIRAIMHASTLAERDDLVKRRNRLGRELAALLKTRTDVL